MPYIPPEIVKKAEEMDLLTYLQNYEPDELVKIGNGTYTTKTHDSMRISNGLWNWFSKGIGGKNAVSYLMKVKNYSFLQAVETIIGNVNIKQPIIYKQEEKDEEIKLILPQKSVNSVRAKKYLESRNIASEIIKECIDNNMIYESMPNHNVVFVAFDDSNVAEVVNTLNEYVKGHKNDYEVPLKEWKIEKINGERMPVLVD